MSGSFSAMSGVSGFEMRLCVLRPRSLSAKKIDPACPPIVAVCEREGDNTFSGMPSLFYTHARRPVMSEHSGKTYRPWEPERYQHKAQSPAAKLPEGDV